VTPISLCGRTVSAPDAEAFLSLPDVRAFSRRSKRSDPHEVQDRENSRGRFAQFSLFSGFPSAQPSRSDLNEIVESAMAVFFAGSSKTIEVSFALDRRPARDGVFASK